MTEIEEIDKQIAEAGKRIWQLRKNYYLNYPFRKIVAILTVAVGYLVVVIVGGLWSLLGALIVFVGLIIGFFAWADNLPYAIIYGDKIDLEKETIASLRARKREISRSKQNV